MPFFTVELNRLADDFTSTDWTVFLHTAAPTDLDPANGRTTAGGGAYVNGATLAASDITAAVNGDIENNAAINFGTATAAVGTVNHWSAYRSGSPVMWGTLPSTTIADGGSFSINANSLEANGSST